MREGTHDCVVVAGVLDDPYTGQTVTFAKADASEVPIDHVVPLAAAWVQGAAAWPADERQAFANDLGNLMATTREENSAKGDSTADEWVPADPSYGCSYATVVITVKSRYALAVTLGRGDGPAVVARHLLRPGAASRCVSRAVGEPSRGRSPAAPSVACEVINDE